MQIFFTHRIKNFHAQDKNPSFSIRFPYKKNEFSVSGALIKESKKKQFKLKIILF